VRRTDIQAKRRGRRERARRERAGGRRRRRSEKKQKYQLINLLFETGCFARKTYLTKHG
jgi:hypothetical protein